MIGWVARMLAAAALAPLALPGAAMAETFTTTGSITVTWQGDPARGCSAEGLCGVQGALILQPEGSVGVGGSGPRRGPIDVPLVPATATVRVSDGAGAGECVDAPSGPGEVGSLLIARKSGGSVVGHVESALSSGRCAGPLQQDLAAVALAGRRIGRAHPSFDLSGSQTFAAGPFTASVVSTLLVRTGTEGGGSQTVTSNPVRARPVPTRKLLVEQVTLRYRIASLPGTLDASFSGDPNPFCAALDSCGAAGSLALSLPGFPRTLTLQASRAVSARVDARQAISDLRRGLLHLLGGGTSPFGSGAGPRVSETFAGAGLSCQDTSKSGQGQLLLGIGPSRSRDRLSVELNSPFNVDLVRTHCPGPSDTDVFGGFPTLARGSVGVPQLLARHSVISLTAPGRFAGVGYVGSRSGGLRFSLTLGRVTAGTVEVMRP